MAEVLTAIVTLAVLSGGIAIGLFWASRKFAVEENPTVTLLENALPGANCGGCGMASCHAFAEHKAAEPGSDASCPVGGSDTAKEIAQILNVEVKETIPMVAKLLCSGTHAVSAIGGLYDGIEDCVAATLLSAASHKLCSFGCLGLGTCVRTCKFDAIRKKDGIVEITEDLCTGCGECISACPQHVLELLPKGEKVYVACSSNDRGGQVKTACMAGCIGCKKCEKTCEVGAITVTDFCARVDQSRCTVCGQCVAVCPSGVIVQVSKDGKPVEIVVQEQEEPASV